MSTEPPEGHKQNGGDYKFVVAIKRAFRATKRKNTRPAEKKVEKYTRHLRNWTGAMAVVAGLTVIVLFLQYCTLSDQFAETRAEQRAWLAPTGIWHDPKESFVVGNPINYLVLFKNIGKTPALRLNWKIENGMYAIPDRKLDVTAAKLPLADLCKGLTLNKNGRVVFPEIGQPTYSPNEGWSPPALPVQSDNTGEGKPVFVTKEMLDGTEAFYVRGCFVYLALNTIIGTSPFCFFVANTKGTGHVASIACEGGEPK